MHYKDSSWRGYKVLKRFSCVRGLVWRSARGIKNDRSMTAWGKRGACASGDRKYCRHGHDEN